MRYSENEINFLCRLIGYGRLAGFDTFSMLSKKDSEEVVQQFTEKNIIEGDLLSKTGLALIQFIKLYCVYYEDPPYRNLYKPDIGIHPASIHIASRDYRKHPFAVLSALAKPLFYQTDPSCRSR